MRAAAAGILLAVVGSALASAPRIYVTFRGKPVKFAKAVQPYRSQRTVMVPFREMGVIIGAKISRNPDGKHVEITFGADNVAYEPGHHGYRLNGHHQSMRGASETRKGRLFVPIRLYNDVTSGLVHAEIR